MQEVQTIANNGYCMKQLRTMSLFGEAIRRRALTESSDSKEEVIGGLTCKQITIPNMLNFCVLQENAVKGHLVLNGSWWKKLIISYLKKKDILWFIGESGSKIR